MVIFRALFVSGFRMVQEPEIKFSTSLDCFTHKEIFYFEKIVRLVLTIRKPDKFVRFSNGQPFCYHLKTEPFHFRTQIDHLNTGVVRILDVHCIVLDCVQGYMPKYILGLSINFVSLFWNLFTSSFPCKTLLYPGKMQKQSP
jgi:hypothetical protein